MIKKHSQKALDSFFGLTYAQKKLVYISIIFFVAFSQIFIFRFTLPFILLTIVAFALVRGEVKQFSKDWVPATLFYFFYEILRGLAFRFNQLTLKTEPVSQLLIDMERKVFFFLSDIPTVVLQDQYFVLGREDWYNNVLFFFYTSFFWYWIATAYILWVKKRYLFKPYIYGLIGFSLVGVIFFYLWPTAPPWLASNQGELPELTRVMWSGEYLPSGALEIVSTYNRNDVAAVPSFHTAWPFFATLFLIKAFGKKLLPLLIWPFLIAFATWYGAEHYIIDSIVGVIFAGSAFVFVHYFTFEGFRLVRREKTL